MTMAVTTNSQHKKVIDKAKANSQKIQRALKRQQLGHRGEEIACEFLMRHNMKILDRNWRCSYGEIDVIAVEGGTLVFCEVKTRSTKKFGHPEESITLKKRTRQGKLASVYCSRTAVTHNDIRFDLITIMVNESEGRAQVNYVRNAYADC